MSFSSNLKTLQSLAQSLDSLSHILSFEDVTLTDYVFIADQLSKLAEIEAKLLNRGIVLEIEEDGEGRPIGHELSVRDPSGPGGVCKRLGVATRWGDLTISYWGDPSVSLSEFKRSFELAKAKFIAESEAHSRVLNELLDSPMMRPPL